MDSINLSTAFNIAITIIGVIGGWLASGIMKRLDALEASDAQIAKALNDLRVELPSNYVAKGDFQKMGDNIFSTLRRIEDKLDNKADKP